MLYKTVSDKDSAKAGFIINPALSNCLSYTLHLFYSTLIVWKYRINLLKSCNIWESYSLKNQDCRYFFCLLPINLFSNFCLLSFTPLDAPEDQRLGENERCYESYPKNVQLHKCILGPCSPLTEVNIQHINAVKYLRIKPMFENYHKKLLDKTRL